MGRYMAIQALIHGSAAVRTWDHRYYVNLGDGQLYDRLTGRRVPMQHIYPRIRTVYNSQHQPIARLLLLRHL